MYVSLNALGVMSCVDGKWVRASLKSELPFENPFFTTEYVLSNLLHVRKPTLRPDTTTETFSTLASR